MRAPELAVGDGALGFWSAVRDVFPETRHQRDWVHTIRTQSEVGWTRRVFRASRRTTQRYDVTYLQAVFSNYDALDQ
jgi:transposase-like protein